MQENCELLRHCFILENTDDALNSTFIQDKQHLESVLGQSQDSWFESLTARQIQCQKSNSVRPKCSVFDSPSCSPTVSQMLRGHLSVGSSPSVIRHSSPAPYCEREESFNARYNLGTPQSDGWERQLPCLSPGPSPIVENKSTLSHPSSSGVYSLGLDGSNLSWTNSLATPPRDPDQSDLLINGTESSATRTKETARALFSPGNKHDTSADSVLPLDSTFEDDQTDLDGSRSDLSQKNVAQSNKNESQTEVIKQIDNLEKRFNKRLITRKGSVTESSKKFRSEHGSNSCDLEDNDSTKRTKLHQETVTDSVGSADSQDFSLSPTFSQKSKCSKVKSCKPQNAPGNERSFIEDVLSDFFDPPAASVGKRKPAPSRKRKSLEMEDTVISDVKSSAEDLCERSGSALDISTPKGSLHPILASDKKTRSSSNKKVRFSDNVQKCTFIPEHDSFFEKRGHKKSARKKMLSTTFSQHKDSPCAESFKNEQYVQVKECKSKVENEKTKCKNAKVRSDMKSENYNDSKQKNGYATHKCSKNVDQNDKRQSSELVKNKTNTNQFNGPENQEVNIAVRQDKKTDKEMENPSVNGVLEENSEEELFSQVSPSALKEMCNVAEKPVEEIKGKDVTMKVENSGTGQKPQKPLKVKHFFYPSVSHISEAASTKVFQFRKDERKELNKKVLLSSVKLDDVVDKDLNMSIDTMKLSKVDENLPEHVENVTDNKVKNKEDSAVQEMMLDTVSDKSSILQTGSSTNAAKVSEEWSDTHYRSYMGFQTAACKPFSMSDQALKSAATLLLEDNSHSSPALESLCNLANHPEDLHHSAIAVRTSMVKSVIKDKPQIELFTELMDSDGHAPQGFKSASGKFVDISTKALVKASAIFSEDLSDSKSGLSCNSSSELIKTGALTQSVGKGAKTYVEYNAGTLSSIPPQTIEKEKHVFHREKLKKEIIQNQVQSKIISFPISFTDMCNGFQLASGKEIQLPEKALEKAVSLLQDENTERTPLNDSKIINKTNVNAEYGIEDALIEDIEFSEWCEEDMEPDENLQTVPIVEDVNKTMIGKEISEEQKENILERHKHTLDYSASKAVASSEIKIHLSTREVAQTEEIDVNKQVSEITDKAPKFVKGCLDKPVNSSDASVVNKWHGRAEKDEKLKASFPAWEETNVKTDTECDSDSKAAVKDDANCFQSKQTTPCSDSNFVGFQTAGGRSLAFSAEKLKHAEKLLNDSETSVTQTFSIQIHHDQNTLIVKKPKNLYTKNTDNDNIRCNVVGSKEGLIRTELCDVLGRDSEVKKDTFSIKSREIQKSIVKELDKKSVAEKLMLEFEKDLVVDGKQNNDLKCVENELKHLADFKRSRMEKKETVKFLSAPAETSMKVPLDRNVPKGFRPFKPPKLTKFSSHEKYPKSVVNDVECTKHTDSVNGDRFNQKTLTNDTSLKTTVKKNILYPEKVWEQGKDSSENNQNIRQNDNIKSNKKIMTEGNTKIANPFADSNTFRKHKSDKSEVSIFDLEGMSQMFEDDMDFTQAVNFGMNECTENQNTAKEKKEDSMTSKEDKENSLNDRVLESERKPNTEDINCTESIPSKESNCIGFSTASGISVSVSATALESALKMLSKCDEGVNMQDSKQRDLNKDEDKIVIVTNIDKDKISSENVSNINSYPGHKEYKLEKAADKKKYEDLEDGNSYENISVGEEKQSNKIPCMNNTVTGNILEQSENVLKEVKKSDNSSILGGTDKEMTQTRREIEYKLPKFVVTSECKQTFFGKEEQKQSVCLFQTASGKLVNISSEALNVARKTLNGIDDEENTDSTNSKCAITTMVGDSVVPECTVYTNKPASSEKLESIHRSAENLNRKTLSKDSKNHPTPESSGFSTASGKKIEVSETALKRAESTVVEDISENNKSSCSDTEVGDKVSTAKAIEVMESSAVENSAGSFVFCGFRSASGEKVHISEKALLHAKASLANETDLGRTKHSVISNDINTALNVTELVTDIEIRNNNNNISKNNVKLECFGNLSNNAGFSTASGKKVSLSDNELNHVRNTFTGDDKLEKSKTELLKYETIFSKKDSEFEESDCMNKELITSDNTNRTNIMQKFEGFSSAAGKVSVPENALQHVKQIFENTHKTCNKLEDEPNFIRFSTDSFSEMQVSKNSLKNTKEKITDSVISDRNIIEIEDVSSCFELTLDNKKEVLNTTIKHASGHLSEEEQLNNPESTEAMFPDFRTTPGIVKVSEDASNYAKENLSEINCFDKHHEDKMKFVNFSTASGENVQVSKETLKHAKACLSDSDSLRLTPESKIKLSTYNKANLSMTKLTEEPLIHSKMHMIVNDKTIENQGLISNSLGFNTASGKTVNVSERALKHAKESFMETTNLFENPEPETIFNGFSTATGKTVTVSEKALKHAKESLKEVSCFNENQELETKFYGKTVIVSEEALKHAKEAFVEKSNLCKSLEPETNLNGFSTASGKTVKVSEKALKHAKESFVENSNLCKSPEPETKFHGFSTASGKTVTVSEKALKHAKESLVEKSNFCISSVPEAKFQGFSTASGKTVMVSEEALKHAKEAFVENSDLCKSSEPETNLNGFSTASGKTVKVSEKALKHVKEPFVENSNLCKSPEPETKFHGFSTASGKTVTVSEKALKHAKESLVEKSDFCKSTAPETKFQGFSTASGKTVTVSEKALKHAKESLKEASCFNENQELETQFHGKTVIVSEEALKHAKEAFVENSNLCKSLEPETNLNGFSTASGKTVKVSEKALKHAKESFVENSNLCKSPEPETKFHGFSTASGKTVTVSEKALKHAKESLVEKSNFCISPVPEAKFQGFSTASGKTVMVSEEALKHAKEAFVENSNLCQSSEPETNLNGFSTASGKTVKVSEKALKHAKESLVETANIFENQEPEKIFNGFKTASGNRVEVSKEALEKVKDHMLLTETTGMAGFDPEIVGCSTALGNKVEISEKALLYVKKNLSETDRLNRDQKAETRFSGFYTASGRTVEVSDTALKLATDSLDKISEGVDSLNQFDKKQTTFCTAFSERISKLHQGNQVEQIHAGNSETEIGDADFEEMFGMALKRRKLDLNREIRMVQNLKDEDSSCKRKTVQNTPKGSTDQRHPGFRPFKPVFCKTLDKQQGRQDVCAVSECSNVTKNVGISRPSFPAPFKTSSEKPTALSSCVSSSNQEMLVKTLSCTPESVPYQGQGDGEDTKANMQPLTTCMLPSGDCKQKTVCRVEEGIQTQHTSVISDLPKTHSGEMQEIEKKAKQLGSKTDVEIPVKIQDGTPKCESDFSKERKASIIDKKVNSDGLDTTQTSDHGDFDSFSQDEDDVFYCMLVEARQHQDNIIKQRGANRVRSVVGRLWKMKQTQNRWKLKDLIDNLGQEKYRPDKNVTSENAINHKFLLESHYGRNTAHVTVGDGAYLVPDDSGKVGKQEFYRAFLTMEGIDGSLVSEAWVYNHYRWIVWKLAAYEKTSTCLRSRCLTPEMVMLQLKYRYDREVDLSQRSAVKKIYERDDTPSKRLALCVAAVKGYNQDGSTVDQSKVNLDERVILELTDGWYSIPAQIDSPLTQLVLRGKIKVGHKLCVTGAELVGGEDACTPLEAPSSVMLRICRNSTRPAPWDSILGYQNDPRPLCVPLSDSHCDGGIVGVVDVVIVRKYPTLFMEKFEGGGFIFRTGRCEDRARQEYEVKKQTEMEKLYRQMENMVEKEQKQEKKVRQRKKFSRTEIEELQSGLDIFEAMEEAGQPDMVQNYLSEHQLRMLYEYQRQLQEQKQVELNSRFQKAWQEKLEVFQERSVTPVLKFRVAGCANRDLDQNTSTILTVWRPAQEISELQEGHRYKIYSLSASASRSKYTGHTVQLTATKQTRFRHTQLDENILDTVYEPREVLWVIDIKRRQPPYGELDFVGIIINVTQTSVSDRMCDTVYLADCQTGILAVRFWNGYKTFGEDLFVIGSVLCCSNLMDKSSYRNLQIPTVEVSAEFTHITNKSQNTAQRKAVDKLLSVAKDKKAFMEKATTVLEQLLNENINQNIPKKILGITNDFIKDFPRSNVGTQSFKTCQTESGSIFGATDMKEDNSMSANEDQEIKNIPCDDRTACKASVDLASERKGATSVAGEANTPHTDRNLSISDLPDVSTPVMERKRSIATAKMARLMSYGSPSVLSPLSITVPRSVTKGFKPPAFKKL